jgi:hypothetical protein
MKFLSSIANIQSEHVYLSPLFTLAQHSHIAPITQEEAFGTYPATEFDETFDGLCVDFTTLGVDNFERLFAAGPTNDDRKF